MDYIREFNNKNLIIDKSKIKLENDYLKLKVNNYILKTSNNDKINTDAIQFDDDNNDDNVFLLYKDQYVIFLTSIYYNYICKKLLNYFNKYNIIYFNHNQIEKVILNVLDTNTRAIKLYKELGFTEEGRQIKAVKQADGEYADMIQMYFLTK